MKIISVKASQSYDVVIGEKLLSQLGKYASTFSSGKAAIISDSNVWPLYGGIAEKSLAEYGIESVHFVFPAGEKQKNAATYLQILNFLADNQITRSDLILALGGGVVGDVAGFAAATYLRGIPYIQIPTSLLAMVDSSVGGKTAIDLPAGKNLVGAFKQPVLVLCDISTLSTLPRALFLDGCAEVIKYGMLYDAPLLAYLQSKGEGFDREQVISRCVAWKRDAVQADEFDQGARQKLNFGHTIGHGIEAGSNFQITHGQAVAAGMAIITRAAAAKHFCEKQVSDSLTTLLQHFGLPTGTDLSLDVLVAAALSDKKRAGNTINLILPAAIGACEIVPIPIPELKSFIEAGFYGH